MSEEAKELFDLILVGCGCLLLAIGAVGALVYVVAAAARLGMGS